MGRGLDMIGNRYTALLTGGGFAAAALQVANFDAQMTRLGTNVGLSSEQVKQWKAEIQSVANANDIRLDKGQMADAIDTLLAKTGDIEFTRRNIRNLGLGIQGFGADAQDVGGLVSQMWEKQIRDADKVQATYDRLYEQFAKGSVSVSDIARVSAKLFSLTMKQGPEAFAEMGALAQIFVKTTGSADEAVTSIASVMKAFSNPTALKVLSQNGIKVFEGDGRTLRPLYELLPEIINAADGLDIKLRQVFTDDTALQGLRSLKSKENQELLREMSIGTMTLGRTQKSAAENANTFKASLQSLTNAMEKFADKKLSGPLQSVADFMNGGSQERQDQVADDLGNAGLVGGAAILARKGWNMLPDSIKKKMAMGSGLVRNVPFKALPLMGAGAMTTAAAQVLGTGFAAYEGTGWLMRMTGLQDKLSESFLGDAIGRAVALSLAGVSSDARQALRQDIEANLNIAFDTNGMPYLKKVDTNGFEVNVEAGGGMQ